MRDKIDKKMRIAIVKRGRNEKKTRQTHNPYIQRVSSRAHNSGHLTSFPDIKWDNLLLTHFSLSQVPCRGGVVRCHHIIPLDYPDLLTFSCLGEQISGFNAYNYTPARRWHNFEHSIIIFRKAHPLHHIWIFDFSLARTWKVFSICYTFMAYSSSCRYMKDRTRFHEQFYLGRRPRGVLSDYLT